MANNIAHHQHEATGWVGWIGFGSAMLMLAGFFHIIAGLVALFEEDVYIASTNAVWIFDYSQWGWIHIFGGALALIAAGSLFQGKMFGRIFAALVASLSAIASMAFVPIYPIWSLIIISIDFMVIWAVLAHGREMQELDE